MSDHTISEFRIDLGVIFNPDQPYKRQAFDPAAPGLKGLEWDGAELYMVYI